MDNTWTAAIAVETAEKEGIDLSEQHWRVIAGAREWIAVHECRPTLAEVSATTGVALEDIQQLFPGAGAELLARLAGAPELERRATS